ncbi:MAG: MobC family plasmid mobilization relaxosome protein [Lachnospiraceae bacterium]|nr:MobC family plasmid mobilization relaxosome protein [Lachnospiraceae bacterium]
MSRRDIEKHIRFTKEEYDIVCKRSAELGLRAGTYIRTIAVQGVVKVFPLKELNDVHRALNRIGVNLNQIATVANSTGSLYQKDMEDVLAEMKQLRIIVEDWLSPLESEELL